MRVEKRRDVRKDQQEIKKRKKKSERRKIRDILKKKSDNAIGDIKRETETDR